MYEFITHYGYVAWPFCCVRGFAEAAFNTWQGGERLLGGLVYQLFLFLIKHFEGLGV